MYYFLKEENFNLEEYGFDIDVSPRFTKREHEILDCFFKFFNVEEEFSEFPQKMMDIHAEELEKVIYNLSKKVVVCRIYKENQKISKFFFNIFDIVVFEESKVIYKFSNEIRLCEKRGNFYSRINVTAFLRFKHSYTKDIFKVIQRENKRKGYVEYSMAEVKELLGIKGDKYTRYYDLERKVFNPTIKDAEFAEVNLWYEKIKNSDSKNSRVVGVRIHYTNMYRIEIHRDTNDLLKRYVDYIEDFTSAYKLIYNYRKIHPLEKTIEHIQSDVEGFFDMSK